MHDARLRAGALAVGALLCTLALPAVAKADAISVKLVTTVPAGQQPRLTITAIQPVDKIELLLNRDDGKVVEETIGSLGVGGWRDVMLDAAVGKHQYSGRITCVSGGKPSATQVSFETTVAGVMTVSLDKSRVDLAHGRLEVQVSIPEGKVELRILSATDGATLVEDEQSFSDHAARDPLVVQWDPPPKDAEVGRVDVRVSDPSGAFQSFSLFPWSDLHSTRGGHLRHRFGGHRGDRDAQAASEPGQDRGSTSQAPRISAPSSCTSPAIPTPWARPNTTWDSRSSAPKPSPAGFARTAWASPSPSRASASKPCASPRPTTPTSPATAAWTTS
jgi:hypothetical protein